MKKICFILILLYSINTFSAVVSDNDGQNFVTKQEFDDLRLSFDKQIDVYNSSLDGKIDGAIASYLAGIKEIVPPENYIENLNNKSASTFRFINKINEVGESIITPETSISVSFEIYKQIPIVFLFIRSKNVFQSPGIYCDVYALDSLKANHDCPYTLFYCGNDGPAADLNGLDWNGEVWYSITDVETEYKNITNTLTKKLSTGSGKVYEYYKKANGNEKITGFSQIYYPQQLITYYIHCWRQYWVKGWGTTDAQKQALKTYVGTERGGDVTFTDTSKANVTVPRNDSWGIHTSGDARAAATAKSDTFTISNQLSKMQAKSVDVDWEFVQISNSDANKEIYCIDQNKKLEVPTTTNTETLDNLTFDDIWISPSGYEKVRQAKIPDINVNYYPISYSTELKRINTFVNDTLTSLSGETVYLGGGVPLTKVYEDSRLSLEIEVALENASGLPTTGNVELKISNKQFKNGAFDGGTAVQKASETVTTTGASGTVVKTYDINCLKDEILWINLNPTTAGYKAYVKSLKITSFAF